jgi:DNA-binding MarR family transcriptional regulator
MTTPGENEALVRALLAVSRCMVALAARNLTALGFDVTLAQYRTLVLLATGGPQRSADLAKELDVAPSTLTRMCDRLERKDLVRRFHRDNDRRSTWLGLTTAGRDLVGMVMRERLRELAEIVARAEVEATPQSLELLDRFVEAAGELPDTPWWERWETSADPVDSVTRR